MNKKTAEEIVKNLPAGKLLTPEEREAQQIVGDCDENCACEACS